MTSSRPYLLRALYEWINDNKFTPYILVNAELPEVQVPKEHVKNGQIVLNISPDAIDEFCCSNIELQFNASFSGIAKHISVPVVAVAAIYAQENGEGMFFGDEPGGDTPPDNSKYDSTKDKKKKRTHLKIVE